MWFWPSWAHVQSRATDRRGACGSARITSIPAVRHGPRLPHSPPRWVTLRSGLAPIPSPYYERRRSSHQPISSGLTCSPTIVTKAARAAASSPAEVSTITGPACWSTSGALLAPREGFVSSSQGEVGLAERRCPGAAHCWPSRPLPTGPLSPGSGAPGAVYARCSYGGAGVQPHNHDHGEPRRLSDRQTFFSTLSSPTEARSVFFVVSRANPSLG